MIKSKTRIEKQLNSKRNPELVETIILAKKNPAWIEIASILSKPSRNRTQLNLERINNLEEEIGNEKFNPNELEIKLKVYPFVLSDLGNLGNSSGSQGIPNYKRIFPTVFEGRVSKTFLKSIGVNISEYFENK